MKLGINLLGFAMITLAYMRYTAQLHLMIAKGTGQMHFFPSTLLATLGYYLLTLDI